MEPRPIEVGRVTALFRYPVKSMAAERLQLAELGWHGFAGDRRLALRKLEDRSGFPWLSASRVPELLRFTPMWREGASPDAPPTHVRTPEGEELPTFGDALASEVGRRLGAPVQMMAMRQGIFDEASVSVIATETIEAICREARVGADVRRFRPNVLVSLLGPGAFQEDRWIGGELVFGDAAAAARVSVTQPDERCAMLNLDPDTAHSTPEVMKAAVRQNANNAGVYGVCVRQGRIAVGDRVFLRGPEHRQAGDS